MAVYGHLAKFGSDIVDFSDFERGSVPSLIELREFYDNSIGRERILSDKGFTELTNTFVRALEFQGELPSTHDERPPIQVEIAHSPTNIVFDRDTGLFQIRGYERIEIEIPREGIQIPSSGRAYGVTGFPVEVQKDWNRKNALGTLTSLYRTNWQDTREGDYVLKGSGKGLSVGLADSPEEKARNDLSFFWTANETHGSSGEPLFTMVKRRFHDVSYGPWHIDAFWPLSVSAEGKVDGDIGYRLKSN